MKSLWICTLFLSVTGFSHSHSNGSSMNVNIQSLELLRKAKWYISERNPEKAFSHLIQVYSIDPNTPGLQNCFESVFRLRIDIGESENSNPKQIIQERFGLASLLIDQERHEEASIQLRAILSKSEYLDKKDKAICMLYRTQASACQWDGMEKDVIISSVIQSLNQHEEFYKHKLDLPDLPPLHPFEALKWPCIGLKEATAIASCYANQAIYKSNKQLSLIHPSVQRKIMEISSNQQHDIQKIKIGYISPDFTSTHPLAFLMQNVFELHNKTDFETFLYSYSRPNNQDSEIQNIKSGGDHWRCTQNRQEMIEFLEQDQLDILIDLCGYAGTNDISYIMAKRLAPIQISYMGFPGSSGASYIDYAIVDPTVIPLSKSNGYNDHPLRQWYTESLIYMPHCYFVNCHKYIMDTTSSLPSLRQTYQLPIKSFVFCCHSRPDKIDPQTFRTWMRAMKRVDNSVLWLLRSGPDMERNLRNIAENEFGIPSHSIVFCDIAPRKEHLKRLAAADLFLDTPAYNAHTLGCDTLYAGVPMISLLRKDNDSSNNVPTEKWVSRVGASLLKATDLNEMIVCNLKEYEDLMVKCVHDSKWYHNIRQRLITNRHYCPLFDTQRWVRNLEIGLREVMKLHHHDSKYDIVIHDET